MIGADGDISKSGWNSGWCQKFLKPPAGKPQARKSPIPPTGPGPGGSSGTAASKDPNEKTGPGGFGPDHFIAAGLALPYRIDFENEASATAPAQRVVITDQLDANFDWNTFQLTEVGFGDVFLAIPDGGQHFQTTVPMTLGDRTFQVEIELSLNAQTGLVTAIFQSIDPATSLPPDVLTGFLPPEDSTGRGQGHIDYIIRPRPALPTGTQIRNVALITFDINEPIATNQIDPHDPSRGIDAAKEACNTIDAGPPTSSIEPLPDVTLTSSFVVNWSGADDPSGAGIATYDVFASDNGGPFTPFLLGTGQTSATFTGQDGHTYAFYTIARDNVGHVETPPTTPDAVTFIRSPNDPPVLDPIGNKSVNEGSLLTFTLMATDPNAGDVLTYSLDPGAPSWANIDPVTGVFSSTPSDGPASFSVTIRVRDSAAPALEDFETITITVENVAPTAVFSSNGPVSEGSSATVTFSDAFDPSADDTTGFLYSFDLDNDGVFDIVDSSTASALVPERLLPDGPATHTVRGRIKDKDGGYTDYWTTIAIENVAPTATFSNGGPVGEGSPSLVSFSSVFDSSSPDTSAGFSYSYDFDNDGAFEISDSTSVSAIVPASYLGDGPGSRIVKGRIKDKDGGFTDYTTAMSINNVAPTAAIAGPVASVRGQPRSFVLSANDPSSIDQTVGFTFTVNWGDGSTEAASGASSLTLEHLFKDSGIYLVQVTARDKDNAISPLAQHTISVTAYEFQDGVLTIGGSPDDDLLLIHPGGGHDGTKVHLNGAAWTFTNVDRIVAFGQEGNDLLQVAESVLIPVELYGGPGNDILNGGGGPSILVGGTGNDLIVGGKGRNLLIGGLGSDVLAGLGGDDILIADDLMSGSSFESQQTAGRNLLNSWNSAEPYANRVAALKDDLVELIFNDDATDILAGGGGLDWFLADLSGPRKDVILDKLFADMATNTKKAG